jgi:hypothetical protein
MKHLKNVILEKLSISNSTKTIQTTKVPDTVSLADKRVFDDVYNKVILLGSNIDADKDDLDELEKFVKTKLPKQLQTKEKIWSYISVVLDFDYMFDEDDMDRFDDGYLHPDWENVDPISEFVYRAVYDKNMKN